MGTFRSNLPLGTSDPDVFIDGNVPNLDEAMNSSSREWTNRFGARSLTYRGVQEKFNDSLLSQETRFSDFLASSGYSGADRPYAAGIQINSHNEGFVKCDSGGQACLFYTPRGDTPLPYTTNGDWPTESALFVVRGDDALRQELLSDSGGANMIGFKRTPLSESIDSVAFFLQGQPYSLWEFSSFADKSTGPNMRDWDWTAALQAAFNTIPEGGALFVPYEEYKITGNPVLADKNINILCLGTFVLSRDPGAFISIFRSSSHTLSGDQLRHLPSKGDMFLYPNTPPVSDGQNYFLTFTSTQDEITRLGGPEYSPYTKNEANEIIGSDMRLRAPVKLNYTQPSALTVNLYKKGTPVRVSGLKMRVAGDGAAVTSKPMMLHLKGVSNVSFDHMDIDRTDSNWPGINILIEECALLDWSKSSIRSFNSAVNDAYAWCGSISAFITLRDCNYVDGNSTKQERGWAGRHCSHVLVDACQFSGVDDHFGHNYIIQNMTMSRGASFAGGSLTLRNITHQSDEWPLVTLRGDTPYADGDLVIDNCTSNFCLLWSIRIDDPKSTKRKTWDAIRITGNSIESKSPRGAITVRDYLPRDEIMETRGVWIEGNKWVRADERSECLFFLGSTPDEDGGTRRLWAVDMFLKDNIFINGYSSSYSSVVDYLKVDRLVSQNNSGLHFQALSSWFSTFDNDAIGINGGGNVSFSDIAGWRMFRGVTFNNSLTGINGSTGNTGMFNCFISGNPFTNSSFVSTIAAMSANISVVDTSGSPGDIWDYKR